MAEVEARPGRWPSRSTAVRQFSFLKVLGHRPAWVGKVRLEAGLVAACGLLMWAACPAAHASGQSAVFPPSAGETAAGEVAIVCTADGRGNWGSKFYFDDLAPFGDTKPGPGGTLNCDTVVGEYLESGPWHIFSPLHPLSYQTAYDLFQRGGISLEAASSPVPLVATRQSVVVEDPRDAEPWMAQWLGDRLRVRSLTPGAEFHQGRCWRLRSPGIGDLPGSGMFLISEDGSAPPPALLRDRLAWRFGVVGRVQIKRGEQSCQAFGLIRGIGGPASLALADRLRADPSTLRVDLGNAVAAPQNSLQDEALHEDIVRLANQRLAALVPFEEELKLAPDRQKELADSVPLVCANLKAPLGIRSQDFVIEEVRGRKVALVGLVDVDELQDLGLLENGWKGEDPAVALNRVLQQLQDQGVKTSILLTNLSPERLAILRGGLDGIAAVLTRSDQRHSWHHRTTVQVEQPEQAYLTAPVAVSAIERNAVGLLSLHFTRQGPSSVLAGASWETQMATETPVADNAQSWERSRKTMAYYNGRRETLLPDLRLLAAKDEKLRVGAGEPLDSYAPYLQARLAASILRHSAGAEIGLVLQDPRAKSLIGDVPRWLVEEWYQRQPVALTSLTGAQLKNLTAITKAAGLLVPAGWNQDQGLVNGRPITDAELYRVAAVGGLAHGSLYSSVFQQGVSDLAGNLQDLVLSTLTGLKSRKWSEGLAGLGRQGPSGGPTAYQSWIQGYLDDDGSALAPRWLLSANQLGLSYQQAKVNNAAPFGAVDNADINIPDYTLIGSQGEVSAIYSAPSLDWVNKLDLSYRSIDVRKPVGVSTPKDKGDLEIDTSSKDDVTLSTELRLNALGLHPLAIEHPLVPFLNGAYLTELRPTVDPRTGIANPRRSEADVILGLVLLPESWLSEVRLGGIAKADWASKPGVVQPGVQLAGHVDKPLGPWELTIDADLRQYLPAARDNASDLATIGEVNSGLSFPLGGGLAVRLGLDAFVFSGKVPDTRSFGTALTPNVGLTYNLNWKPQVGLAY